MDFGWIDPARIRPLRRVEYEHLVAMGCFGRGERVELLRGFVVRMTPIGPPHCESVERIQYLLYEALKGRARVRAQASFALSDDSEPEPDVFVFPLGDYRTEHPQKAFLIVEVAESSLRFDRRVKRELYAEAGIPEYWIVNLIDRCVEVADQPGGGVYGRSRTYRPGESITLGAFPDVVVPVERVLP